jgi:predicted nucleotidyltransferase
MTQDEIVKNKITLLCKSGLQECSQLFGFKIHTAVLFGSCAKEVIKKQTDVDIFIVSNFFELNRPEKTALAVNIEQVLDRHFVQLESGGHYLNASVHLKTENEFNRPSRLYWDMIDFSIPLFESNGLLKLQIENTKKWLKRGDARRENRGLSWAWIFEKPEFMGFLCVCFKKFLLPKLNSSRIQEQVCAR